MTTRFQKLNHWLNEVLCLNKMDSEKDYRLEPTSGDASFRCYFRLIYDDETFIVMDAPPVQEDCALFLDIAERLLAVGLNVPKIIKKDLEQGFLLLSDLGDDQYLPNLTDINADGLYGDAIQTLCRMQKQTDISGLPLYDEKLLLQEMELFRYWLLEKHIGLELSEEMGTMLDDIFQLLIVEALEQPKVFVHRDYHSRNLMMTTANNPGVLDFQDAVVGPFTYDLVSLLKDCYIKWPTKQIRDWANRFFQQHVNDYPDIDEERFIRWFDLMGVQRHLKASGIFARLCLRDGKTAYLADIPRTLSYIVDLKKDYPELRNLIMLIQEQVMTSQVISSSEEEY